MPSRRRGGDDNVAGECQEKAAAQCKALDTRHHCLIQKRDRTRQSGSARLVSAHAGEIGPGQFLEIAAGAKAGPRPGQHNGPCGGILVGPDKLLR